MAAAVNCARMMVLRFWIWHEYHMSFTASSRLVKLFPEIGDSRNSPKAVESTHIHYPKQRHISAREDLFQPSHSFNHCSTRVLSGAPYQLYGCTAIQVRPCGNWTVEKVQAFLLALQSLAEDRAGSW